MWYVIWTSTGSEQRAVTNIKPRADRCFVPQRVVNIRKNTQWKQEKKALFPGYIFADTDNIEELASKLYNIEGFNRILDIDRKYYPLIGSDAELIEELYANDGLFDASTGYIEGDKIHITAGPLFGREGQITKIDRHKRTATIKTDIFGHTTTIKVGLEIIDKK